METEPHIASLDAEPELLADGAAPESKSPGAGVVAASPSSAAQANATLPAGLTNHRILVVDDNPAIHEDFRKVLCSTLTADPDLLRTETALFGTLETPTLAGDFQLHSAYQGQEALAKVRQALAEGEPYALAFVDVRMPPGWDGIETVTRLWEVCPDLQIVICTAYSDYSWDEMIRKLGANDNLVILKKPFDNVEVMQLAHAFTRKWELNRQAQLKLGELSRLVEERTRELQAANEELRREVQDRLLAERQLRHAQKMEAIGQLAAGVAHDFNNILTVIHGHASMLLLRLGEHGVHTRSVTEIRHSAERAANLVRQLLMFSRKQVMQFRNVELGEVIRSVSGMLRQLVGEHITLAKDCGTALPPIYADRGMIEQVIVNLTINSRDAMARGGRVTIQSEAVTVAAEMAAANPEARAGQFICLTVADTGCGMDARAMAHLFEPFFTTKEAGKGTGLGLATVYGIVRQHQGWIEVKSQVNVGTTFRIFFPVSDQANPQSSEERAESPTRTGTETILIAEDEPALREMVAEILSLRGYHVLSANSGPAALDIWHREQSRIDLLLTDLVMPGGMMGTEVAAQLKRGNPNLKVIYTTGYSPGTAGMRDALQEGVNFLAKPYSPNTLAEIVRRSLDS